MPVTNNEPIKLHMHDIISNPTGKQSAYLANRLAIKENLKARFILLLKKYNKFDYKIYKVDVRYIFHFKIPSETYKDFFYDVILEFYPEDDSVLDDKTINNYYVRIFSNSPAFMFTYTYVCYNNGMIPTGLKKFCSKNALNTPPTIKNPVEVYGYEKSVYFACLYIAENKLYNKFTISKALFKYKKDTFDNTIQSQDFKLMEYNKEKKNVNRAKKKAKVAKQAAAKEAVAKATKKKVVNKKRVSASVKNKRTTKKK